LYGANIVYAYIDVFIAEGERVGEIMW